jgi:hypothetical protein
MKLSTSLQLRLTILLMAGLGTALCALIYVTVHQSYRQTANDPQIQLAEDGAQQLAHGVAPAQIAG